MFENLFFHKNSFYIYIEAKSATSNNKRIRISSYIYKNALNKLVPNGSSIN